MESNVERVQIEVADNQNIEEDGDTYKFIFNIRNSKDDD